MTIPLTDLRGRLRTAVARSELLRALASVRRDGGKTLALGDVSLRPLSAEEIAQLEERGNTAEDWSRVLVADGFDPRRVCGTDFQGDVVLGRFTDRVPFGGVTLSAGIVDATIADCVIGHDALVREVTLLANCVVGPGAILLDCGRITCDPGTTFGNGAVLPIGCETGGRPVAIFAEMDVELASALAQPSGRRELVELHAAVLTDYLARAGSGRGVIERGAHVMGTRRLHNVFIGPGSRIDGATVIENCTLLSSEEERVRVQSGACVSDSLVQWGCSISTLAVVSQSLLTEHAHVERHGKLSCSILGPNTSVGGGEVTSALLGPFVACHHQSLVIATLWPGGRGNVGYGANVGSNHTSRAPDQECRVGEGVFFGLGVNVKFPADFSAAPYTVIACGSDLLPQKIAFPFSLIAPPSTSPPGVSPAYMEIVPGWMLRDNLYALRRNEAKYRARNRARRTGFDFDFLRPDTVELIRAALARLEDVDRKKEFYTEEDIDGLGKNFLAEKHRTSAVDAYRFFLRYYALLGLLAQARTVLDVGHSAACAHLLEFPGSDPRWEHTRQILIHDLGVRDVLEGLRELPAMLEKVGRSVEDAKARDDRRGERMGGDYAETHIPAERDECVRGTWEEVRLRQAEVSELLSRLQERLVKAG